MRNVVSTHTGWRLVRTVKRAHEAHSPKRFGASPKYSSTLTNEVTIQPGIDHMRQVNTHQWVVEGELSEALLDGCQVAVKAWGEAARCLLLQLPQA